MVLIHRLDVYLKHWFMAHVKNIITYSQMRYQLYQSHSLTATGLKSGKKVQIIASLSAFQRPQCDFKIKASDFKSVTHKDYT